MNKIYYSQKENGFFDDVTHGENLPEDCLEVSLEIHEEMMKGQLSGMMITHDSKGMPGLILPAPSKYHTLDRLKMEWKITKANQSKLDADNDDADADAAYAEISAERAKCDKAILPLQDALDLGIETDEEKAELLRWKRYRVALNRWVHPQDKPVF